MLGTWDQDWRENLGIKFFWNPGILAVALVVFVLRENSHDAGQWRAEELLEQLEMATPSLQVLALMHQNPATPELSPLSQRPLFLI